MVHTPWELAALQTEHLLHYSSRYERKKKKKIVKVIIVHLFSYGTVLK